MSYRGLPYFMPKRANASVRGNQSASRPYGSLGRARSVRHTAKPRRVVTLPQSFGAIQPARAIQGTTGGKEALTRINPLRIVAVLMIVIAIAFFSALIGIVVTRGFVSYVDGTSMEGNLFEMRASADTTSLSTPRSAWEKGTVPSLYQIDPQWADQSYGPQTIGNAGTAPLCLAMVHIDLTGSQTTGPIEIASFSEQAGYADRGDDAALLVDGAAELGLNAQSVEASEVAIRRQLNAGHPIICATGPGMFGDENTYITLDSIDEYGRIIICDPLSRERTEQHWSFEDIINESTALWAYTLP